MSRKNNEKRRKNGIEIPPEKQPKPYEKPYGRRIEIYEPFYQWYRLGNDERWQELRELIDELVDELLGSAKIMVMDKTTGEAHEVGTDPHDLVWVSDEGTLHYFNGGDGCGPDSIKDVSQGYCFCITDEYDRPDVEETKRHVAFWKKHNEELLKYQAQWEKQDEDNE